MKGPLGSVYRSACSLRLVLVLGRRDSETSPIRFASLPGKPPSDRRREFEEQSARIEAQLAVLEQDTGGEPGRLSPAGRRIRLRRLELTRALLYDHLQTAKRLSRRTSTLSRLQEQLQAAGRPNAAVPHIDDAELSGAAVNLERLADALFLFEEILARLDRSDRSKKNKGDGRAEGVA